MICQQLLLCDVDDMFSQSLQTKYIGYLKVTTFQTIDHLYNHYARILVVYLQEK